MIRRLALLVVFTVLLLAPAAAQKRVALVIGIDDYRSVPRLQRAVADARAVAKALGELGFKVHAVENPDRVAISRAFAAFEEQIDKGDTAFVFFAGHGIEIRGQNFLLPADAPDPNATSEGVLKDNGFLTPALIDRVTDRGARAAFFVIDACRNNPYAQPGARRSVGATRGLAKVEAPEGVFVLMSAGQNQEALDSLNLPGKPVRDAEPNSVFTRVFLDELAQPGLTHLQLAKNVQTRVRDLAREIDHPQVPAFTDQIIGNVVFKEARAVAVTAAPVAPPPEAKPPAPPPAATAPDPLAAVREHYDRAERINTAESWRAFLATNPPVPYADFARAALAKIVPPTQPQPVPPSRTQQGQPPSTPTLPLASEETPEPIRSPNPIAIDVTKVPRLKVRLTSAYSKSVDRSAERFAQRVKVLSQNRIEISVFFAGEIVPASMVLSMTESGAVEFGWGPGSQFADKDAGLALMTTVPLGFRQREHVLWRQRRDVAEAVDRLLAPRGATATPCSVIGSSADMWMRHRIEQPEDLRGMKLRVVGLQAEVLQALGVIPRVPPGSDLQDALDRGLIDGLIFGSLEVGEKLGLDKGTPYVAYPGVLAPSHVVDLFYSRTEFSEKLGSEGRKVVAQACAETLAEEFSRSEKAEREALARLRSKGITVQPLPAAVLRALAQAADKAIPEALAWSDGGRNLYALIQSERARTLSLQLR